MSRGLTLFAYIRTVNGKLFMADAHIKSLLEAGEKIGLKLASKDKLYLNAELAARKNLDALGGEATVRILLTASHDVAARIATDQPAMVAILAAPLPVYDEKLYKAGIKTKLVEGARPLPELKHTFYMQPLAINGRENNELIYKTVDGDLLEASTANLFFVNQNNQIVTADKGVYRGVTRGIVINILESQGEKIIRQPINIAELGDVKEAFVTSTSKGVLPIKSIDFKVFGGRGKRTKEIIGKYNDFVRNHS